MLGASLGERTMASAPVVPQLLLQIADQLLKPFFGERVKRLLRHPAGLLQPSLQFLSVSPYTHALSPLVYDGQATDLFI
jgi:hypothetical protein